VLPQLQHLRQDQELRRDQEQVSQKFPDDHAVLKVDHVGLFTDDHVVCLMFQELTFEEA
jgi:hypothetical protein